VFHSKKTSEKNKIESIEEEKGSKTEEEKAKGKGNKIKLPPIKGVAE
jgi:hypothetical protein